MLVEHSEPKNARIQNQSTDSEVWVVGNGLGSRKERCGLAVLFQ